MKIIFTIEKQGKAEIIEKKSRFIANVFPIYSKEEAEEHILSIKKEFWDAKHCVYAYVLENNYQKYSDDGEPQGTGGLPILNIIKRNGLKNVLVTVTRYFGGILLGKGGLMRVYAEVAVLGIEDAKPIEIIETSKYVIKCEYNVLEILKNLFEKNGCLSQINYKEDVEILLEVPKEKETEITQDVKKITNDRIVIKKLSE